MSYPRELCREGSVKKEVLNKDNLAVQDHFQFLFPIVYADKANWNK